MVWVKKPKKMRCSDSKFTYKHVEYDKHGWADANKYLPIPCDLVDLKVKGKDGVYPGWYTGNGWSGRRVKEHYEILAWKRKIHLDGS